MKRGEWGMNSSRCDVHTHFVNIVHVHRQIREYRTTHHLCCPGDGGHGVMEGYEET